MLESKLVKEQLPLFNRMLRRVSSYAILQKDINGDGYATIKVHSGRPDDDVDLGDVYGLYESRTKAKKRLEEMTKTFQLCPKLMGIENTKSACFSYSLGKCKGACIGKESVESYNRRFEIALEHTRIEQWPYDTPIAVQMNHAGEAVVINNWIVQGYLNEEGELQAASEPQFDMDEYKIVRRFIRENKAAVQKYIPQ
jgi:excinuclease UvrABC nuclease subunit